MIFPKTAFKWLLAISLFFLAFPTKAQEKDFDVYDTQDGLPTPFITDVFEDSLGRLIVSTREKTFLYDGYGFNGLESDQPDLTGWLWFIEKNKQNVSWGLSFAGTLHEFSEHGLVGHVANDTLAELFGGDWMHTTFGFLNDDTIAIGFKKRPYYATVTTSGEVEKVPLPEHETGGIIYVRRSQSGFVSGSYGVLVSDSTIAIKIDNQTTKCKKYSKFDRALCADVAGSVLIVDHRDAYLIRNGELVKHKLLKGGVNCISVDQFDNIWIGYSRHGVECWSGDLEQKLTDALGNAECNAIFEDREGNMWFATRNGLFRMIESTIASYNQFSSGKLANPAPPVFIYGDSVLWLENQDGMAYYKDGKLKKEPLEKMVDLEYQVKPGGMLVAKTTGLYQRSEKGLYRITPKGIFSGLVFEPDGSFWTFSGNNIIKVDQGQKVTFSAMDSFENWPKLNHLTRYGELYFKDAEGYLWFGLGGDLYRFKGSSIQKVIRKAGDMELENVQGAQLINGVVWLITRHGLWALTDDTTAYIGEASAIGARPQLCKESDTSLWAFGTVGAVRVEFRHDNGYLNHSLAYFNHSLGLNSSSIRHMTSYDNRVWFSTRFGISGLNVAQWLKRKQVPPIIHLKGVIDEKNGLVVDDATSLEHDHNSLSMRFISYTFLGRNKPKYTYRLLGGDSNWYNTLDTSIQFSGLTPGEYRFEVKAINAHGTMSNHSSATTFTINPPYWRTWWFVTIVIILLQLIVGGIIVSINRAKRRALLSERDALESELKTIRMQVNPHFMYNALNNIREMVTQGDQEKAPDQILKFSRLMRKILNATRKKYISLAEEVEVLRAYLEFANVRFEGRVDYSIEVDPNLQEQMQVLNFPPLLTQPLVENAMIHGASKAIGQGRIEVDITKVNDYIHLQILDNGPGMRSNGSNTDKDHQSAGMSLIEEQIRKLNTTLKNKISIVFSSVDDKTQIGTRVVIKVPVELF